MFTPRPRVSTGGARHRQVRAVVLAARPDKEPGAAGRGDRAMDTVAISGVSGDRCYTRRIPSRSHGCPSARPVDAASVATLSAVDATSVTIPAATAAAMNEYRGCTTAAAAGLYEGSGTAVISRSAGAIYGASAGQGCVRSSRTPLAPVTPPKPPPYTAWVVAVVVRIGCWRSARPKRVFSFQMSAPTVLSCSTPPPIMAATIQRPPPSPG